MLPVFFGFFLNQSLPTLLPWSPQRKTFAPKWMAFNWKNEPKVGLAAHPFPSIPSISLVHKSIRDYWSQLRIAIPLFLSDLTCILTICVPWVTNAGKWHWRDMTWTMKPIEHWAQSSVLCRHRPVTWLKQTQRILKDLKLVYFSFEPTLKCFFSPPFTLQGSGFMSCIMCKMENA